MKISKYIALLLLLFSISFSVFIVTLKSEYTIKVDSEIAYDKDLILKFITNSKNMNQWFFLAPIDSTYQFSEDAKKNSASWIKEDSKIQLLTKYLATKDTIKQKLIVNNQQQESLIILKTKQKNTSLQWIFNGKLSFFEKINNLLFEKVSTKIEKSIHKSIAALEISLTERKNEYSITIFGFSEFPELNYIQQKDSTTLPNFDTQVLKTKKNVETFLTSNLIQTKNNPFVVVHRWDETNNKVVYSFGYEIEEEIVSTTNPKITGGNLAQFLSLKIRLIGDIKLHRKELMEKATAYLEKNKYEEDFNGKYLEIFIKTPTEDDPYNSIIDVILPVKKKYRPIVKKDSISSEVENDVISN